MATIVDQIRSLGPQAVECYDRVAVHDQAAVEAMRAGESALWIARPAGTYFAPVRVENDKDLDGAEWQLGTFDRIAAGPEAPEALCLIERAGPQGQDSVTELTVVQARELLIQRIAGLLQWALEDAS